MPQEIVHIDATAETAAIPKPTFTDVGIVGTSETAPSGASFGEPERYTAASDVSNDFGEDTDVHNASQVLESKGAAYWYVLVLEAVEYADESVDDGETVDNTPILGDHDVSTANGDPIEYSTEDPPTASEDDAVAINTETGEVALGANVTGPVDLTYYSADFGNLDHFTEDVNRLGMADRRMAKEHIGVLDAANSWASANDVGMVAAGPNGDTYADDSTAMDVYHAVFGYVQSGDLMAIAHKSSDDWAAEVLGILATKDPWFDPFYAEVEQGTSYYRKKLIGDPSTSGTFEGGDDANQEGPVNVIINKAGTDVLSNSLTTAGSASDYQYFDIARTETFIAAEIERALTSARLRNDQIPFTEDGQDIIENVINDAVMEYVGGSGQPLSDATINVPHPDDLPDDDVANRNWTGISVDGTLAGNVHEFSLSLTVGV